MSRRPPAGPPRTARMAPGGRLWSESPVRRPYPRVRQAGEEPAAPVVPPVWMGGGTAVSAPEMKWAPVYPVAGDTLVSIFCALGAVTPPTGWTVAWSGTVNGRAGDTYTYGVAHGIAVGGAQVEGVFTGPRVGEKFWAVGDLFRGNPITPQLIGAVATTGPGVTSRTFLTTAGTALLFPTQVAILVSNSSTQFQGTLSAPITVPHPARRGFGLDGLMGEFSSYPTTTDPTHHPFEDGTYAYTAPSVGCNAVAYSFGYTT